MVPEDSRGYGDRWAKYPHFIWSHFAGSIGNVIPTSEHTFLPLFNTCLGHSHIFTVRNEVAKVMFLQASVCPQGGGGVCLSACWDTTPPRGRHPSGADTPPGADTPLEQTPPPGADTPGADTPRRVNHCCGRYVPASFTPAFKVSWKVGAFSLCMVFTSPRLSRAVPHGTKGTGPGFVTRPVYSRSQLQEQHEHYCCSSSTDVFISYSIYTVRRYRTSPGAPDLRARLGWLQGSTRNGM